MEKIRFVSITGADDSVGPSQLLKLSQEFPFVEWAILFSQKSIGTNRFPSAEWLDEIGQLLYSYGQPVNLSLHLCGSYVRQLIERGHDRFAQDLGADLFDLFNRVQINTHGDDHKWNVEGVVDLIKTYKTKEFIFQLDGNGKNEAMAKMMVLEHRLENVSFLLDTSHGAGILPSNWPSPPLSTTSTGYAGGIGPENIEESLVKIRAAVDARTDFKADYWIDMETKVRSNNDQLFDLAKVRQVLEITKPLFEAE